MTARGTVATVVVPDLPWGRVRFRHGSFADLASAADRGLGVLEHFGVEADVPWTLDLGSWVEYHPAQLGGILTAVLHAHHLTDGEAVALRVLAAHGPADPTWTLGAGDDPEANAQLGLMPSAPMPVPYGCVWDPNGPRTKYRDAYVRATLDGSGVRACLHPRLLPQAYPRLMSGWSYYAATAGGAQTRGLSCDEYHTLSACDAQAVMAMREVRARCR